MKIKKIFLSMAAATMLFAACGNDKIESGNSNTTPVDASCPAVEFSQSNSTSFEVDPADPTFSLTIERKATDAASYNINVIQGADKFNVPATVDFAANETEKELTISVKDGVQEGVANTLELKLDDAVVNPYTQGIKDLFVNVTVIKWEAAGTGYWVGNIVNRIFSVESMPMYVEYEKATTSTAVKYRFQSPYGAVVSARDEMGAYDAYPYNEAGDVTGNGGKFVITVTENGASLAPVLMGMNWGYGEFEVGQIYGYLSQNIGSYPLGTYTASKTGGVITWPASSLYVSMSEYNDGGQYPCNAPTVFYLSKEDYAASMEE